MRFSVSSICIATIEVHQFLSQLSHSTVKTHAGHEVFLLHESKLGDSWRSRSDVLLNLLSAAGAIRDRVVSEEGYSLKINKSTSVVRRTIKEVGDISTVAVNMILFDPGLAHPPEKELCDTRPGRGRF